MHVAVVGAGSMGHGIAQVSAMAGHSVRLHDLDETRIREGVASIESNLDGGVERGKLTADEREATLERVVGEPDLESAVSGADLVVEAVPEDVDLKKDVFTDVEASAPEEAIVASNTSSLSVTELASVLEDPGRCVGLHFFNPPHLVDLVEVVVAEQTGPDVERTAVEYVEGLGKEAVVVRDSAGFASSRLGVVLGRKTGEGFYVWEDGETVGPSDGSATSDR